MATKQTKANFTFINSSIAAPPQDPATKARIRKQAIKQAFAARKQDGTQKKYNIRQCPVFIQDITLAPLVTDGVGHLNTEFGHAVNDHIAVQGEEFYAADKPSGLESDDGETANVKRLALVIDELKQTIPATLSIKGCDLIPLKYGFNILELSDLATFHVGRATRNFLSSDPSQLVNFRQYKPWSFFSFLPSCYEHSPCVKYAADCVAARVGQILSPGEIRHSTVIGLYVKALKNLQQALNCPKRSLKPEVLFATEIMAIYELLATSEQTGWIRHAAGAARLIQLRGPKNYTTDFEKALFMAHAGTISNEALLNNERCFLEEEPWKEVFQSIIIKDSAISDRSEVAISLLMIKASVAGIMKDVSKAVSHQLYINSPFVIAVSNRARELRINLLTWHGNHKKVLGDGTSDICTGTIEGDSRCKVMGVYLSCLMLSNRLIAAVSPREQQKREEEAQQVVTKIFELQKHIAMVRPQASLFVVQSVGLAHVTRATTQDWQDTPESKEKDLGSLRRVISRWKFERWCELFGRKMS